MKKNIALGIILISVIALLSAAIIGCHPNQNDSTESTVSGTDSSLMQKDNTNTAPIPVDSTAVMTPATSAAATIDSTGSTASAAKPDPSKKGKKGRVSVGEGEKGTGDMTPDSEGYYSNAEVLPAFPGGQKALESFFEKNLQYPEQASENGVEGTVRLNFSVDEAGKIYAPKIVSQKIGYGLEDEAVTVFSKMPKWTPGRIKGKNVKTRFTLPVKFILAD